MDKKLLALLIVIPLSSIAITWWVYDYGQSIENANQLPRQETDSKISDTFFKNAKITNFSELGLPKSKINSPLILHYPGDEESELSDPDIILFREKGSPVKVAADKAWINKAGTRVTLVDHTIVKRELTVDNAYFKLQSPELIIWPNNDYVETDKAVTITTDTTIVNGIGMEAYLDKEHYYILHDVKVNYMPQRAPQKKKAPQTP